MVRFVRMSRETVEQFPVGEVQEPDSRVKGGDEQRRVVFGWNDGRDGFCYSVSVTSERTWRGMGLTANEIRP